MSYKKIMGGEKQINKLFWTSCVYSIDLGLISIMEALFRKMVHVRAIDLDRTKSFKT